MREEISEPTGSAVRAGVHWSFRGLRRLDEEEFGRAAYRAMEVVFQVHNEFGRLLSLPHFPAINFLASKLRSNQSKNA